MQQAADELGIPQPSQIIGAVDDQSRQLLALAIREGKDFSVLANGAGGWQNLHKEYVFFTQVLTATTGDITSGSPVITNIPSTAGVTAETFFVDGTDLPIKAKVVSVDSGFAQATATASGWLGGLDHFLPVLNILIVLAIIMLFEVSIFGYKVIRWLYRKIPGIS